MSVSEINYGNPEDCENLNIQQYHNLLKEVRKQLTEANQRIKELEEALEKVYMIIAGIGVTSIPLEMLIRKALSKEAP